VHRPPQERVRVAAGRATLNVSRTRRTRQNKRRQAASIRRHTRRRARQNRTTPRNRTTVAAKLTPCGFGEASTVVEVRRLSHPPRKKKRGPQAPPHLDLCGSVRSSLRALCGHAASG